MYITLRNQQKFLDRGPLNTVKLLISITCISNHYVAEAVNYTSQIIFMYKFKMCIYMTITLSECQIYQPFGEMI